MKKEITVTAKTLEEAISSAKTKLGELSGDMNYEILEFPKKGILGIGASPAVIKVTYNVPDPDPALSFINTLVSSLELKTEIKKEIGEEGETRFYINGEDAGILIGHHGETLDALQYLTSLAANRRVREADGDDENSSKKKDFVRVTVDVENYREKRTETLRQLAKRMAARVLKYKRSVTLEPMNPYERRIIHSEIQTIEGVTTHSVGTDAERRVVITLDNGKDSKDYRNKGSQQRHPYRGGYRSPADSSSDADNEGVSDNADSSADENEADYGDEE